MALILCLETATKNCSVAINKDGCLLAYKEEVSENYSHSEQLIPFIQSVLIDQKLELADLDAIAVSKGPGSYTGLRIGVSTAKGLCYSLGIPLLAHSTLETMAMGMTKKIPQKVYCPMIDARRMEVYTALFNEEKQLTNIEACIVDENSFYEDLAENEILFFGDGADKCQQVITHKNASFINDVYPSAKDMVPLSESAFQHERFEDVAYFEPFYLKDFVTSAKK